MYILIELYLIIYNKLDDLIFLNFIKTLFIEIKLSIYNFIFYKK